MWQAHHLTVSIGRAPAEVIPVAADLSRWAAGVGAGMTDESFAADVAAVTADLGTLKGLLES